MSQIIVVSAAHRRLRKFMAALEEAAGMPVLLAGRAETAALAARDTAVALVIIDGLSDLPVFELVREILSVNACIHTAIISSQSEEAFGEAAEGLGILMRLPESPEPVHAVELWRKLAALGGAPPVAAP